MPIRDPWEGDIVPSPNPFVPPEPAPEPLSVVAGLMEPEPVFRGDRIAAMAKAQGLDPDKALTLARKFQQNKRALEAANEARSKFGAPILTPDDFTKMSGKDLFDAEPADFAKHTPNVVETEDPTWGKTLGTLPERVGLGGAQMVGGVLNAATGFSNDYLMNQQRALMEAQKTMTGKERPAEWLQDPGQKLVQMAGDIAPVLPYGIPGVVASTLGSGAGEIIEHPETSKISPYLEAAGAGIVGKAGGELGAKAIGKLMPKVAQTPLGDAVVVGERNVAKGTAWEVAKSVAENAGFVGGMTLGHGAGQTYAGMATGNVEQVGRGLETMEEAPGAALGGSLFGALRLRNAARDIRAENARTFEANKLALQQGLSADAPAVLGATRESRLAEQEVGDVQALAQTGDRLAVERQQAAIDKAKADKQAVLDAAKQREQRAIDAKNAEIERVRTEQAAAEQEAYRVAEQNEIARQAEIRKQQENVAAADALVEQQRLAADAEVARHVADKNAADQLVAEVKAEREAKAKEEIQRQEREADAAAELSLEAERTTPDRAAETKAEVERQGLQEAYLRAQVLAEKEAVTIRDAAQKVREARDAGEVPPPYPDTPWTRVAKDLESRLESKNREIEQQTREREKSLSEVRKMADAEYAKLQEMRKVPIEKRSPELKKKILESAKLVGELQKKVETTQKTTTKDTDAARSLLVEERARLRELETTPVPEPTSELARAIEVERNVKAAEQMRDIPKSLVDQNLRETQEARRRVAEEQRKLDLLMQKPASQTSPVIKKMMEKATARRDAAQKTLDQLTERRKKILENADMTTHAGQMEVARRINETPIPAKVEPTKDTMPVVESKPVERAPQMPRKERVEDRETLDEVKKSKIPGMSFQDAENLNDLRRLPEEKHTGASRAMLKELEKKEAKAKDIQDRIAVLKSLPDTPERRKQIADMERASNAEAVRSDTRQTGEEDAVGAGQDQRGENLQREAQGQTRDGSDGSVQRKETLNEAKIQKHLESLPQHKTIPGHTEAIMGILRARAKALGEDINTFIGRRFAGIEYLDVEKMDKAGNKIGGEIEKLAGDGRRLIRVFKSGDASTVLHETLHQFRSDMTGADLEIASKEVGAKNPNAWTRQNEEKFVALALRWFRDGKSPSPELDSIFKKFKGWLTNVYHTVLTGPLKDRPSPAMEGVLNRLLTKADAREMKSGGEAESPDVLNAKRKKTEKIIPEAHPELPKVSAGQALRNEEAEIMKAEKSKKGERLYPEEVRAADEAFYRNNREYYDEQLAEDAKKGKFDQRSAAMAQERMRVLEEEGKGGSEEWKDAVTIKNMIGSQAGSMLQLFRDTIKTPEGRWLSAKEDVANINVNRKTFTDYLRKKAEIKTLKQTLESKTKSEQDAIKRRINKLQEDITRFERERSRRIETDKEILRKHGFDLDAPDIPAWANDPHKAAQLRGLIRKLQMDWIERAGEWYSGILHASFGVFFKKAAADIGGMAQQNLNQVTRGVAGDLQRMFGWEGETKLPSTKESLAMLGAYHEALGESYRAGKEALVSGWEPQGLETSEKIHAPSIFPESEAIRHLSGISTMQGMTAFTKMVMARSEARLWALRQGHGDAWVEKQMSDRDSEAWTRGKEIAGIGTLTNASPGARTINALKYSRTNGDYVKMATKALAHIVAPFYNIPVNVVYRQFRDWIPVTSELIAVLERNREVSAYEGSKNPNKERPKEWQEWLNGELGQAIARYSVLLGIYGLYASGVVGINGPDDPENPNTIKIGNYRFSIAGLGPVLEGPLHTLGALATPSSHKTEREERLHGKAAAATEKMAEQVWDITKSAPVASLVDEAWKLAAKETTPAALAAKHTPLPLPSVWGQTERAAGESEVDVSGAKRSESFIAQYLQRMKERFTGPQGAPLMKEGKGLERDRPDPFTHWVIRLGVHPTELSEPEDAIKLFRKAYINSDRKTELRYPAIRNVMDLDHDRMKKVLQTSANALAKYTAAVKPHMTADDEDALDTFTRWDKGAKIIRDAAYRAEVATDPNDKAFWESVLSEASNRLKGAMAFTESDKETALKRNKTALSENLDPKRKEILKKQRLRIRNRKINTDGINEYGVNEFKELTKEIRDHLGESSDIEED